MTLKSLDFNINQLADWWLNNRETATEQADNTDWLGWDGWVSVTDSSAPDRG